MSMKMKMTWEAGTRCKVAFKSHLRLWGAVRGKEGQLTFLRSDRLDFSPVANASTRYCSHLGNSVRAGHTFRMGKAFGETLHYISIFPHFMWLLTWVFSVLTNLTSSLIFLDWKALLEICLIKYQPLVSLNPIRYPAGPSPWCRRSVWYVFFPPPLYQHHSL